LAKNEQKEPWFTAINPNGRIPAMTDKFSNGESIRLFESGAMQKYLVERYDKDYKLWYPPDTPEHHEMYCWVLSLLSFSNSDKRFHKIVSLLTSLLALLSQYRHREQFSFDLWFLEYFADEKLSLVGRCKVKLCTLSSMHRREI